jgi:hypothetical protein
METSLVGSVELAQAPAKGIIGGGDCGAVVGEKGRVEEGERTARLVEFRRRGRQSYPSCCLLKRGRKLSFPGGRDARQSEHEDGDRPSRHSGLPASRGATTTE